MNTICHFSYKFVNGTMTKKNISFLLIYPLKIPPLFLPLTPNLHLYRSNNRKKYVLPRPAMIYDIPTHPPFCHFIRFLVTGIHTESKIAKMRKNWFSNSIFKPDVPCQKVNVPPYKKYHSKANDLNDLKKIFLTCNKIRALLQKIGSRVMLPSINSNVLALKIIRKL